MEKTERNSSFELLRLLCIFGIVFIHTLGPMLSQVSGFNAGGAVFANSLFNTGVTCFILISGYFGLNFNIKKIIACDMTIVFYSLLGLLSTCLLGMEMDKAFIFKSFFPVITNKYWFISCYFVLWVLSPFLNRIPEKLTKRQYKTLLLALLFIFSVLPTFFYFEIMGDGGKGIVHMIMIYLLGRYIRLYWTQEYKKSHITIIFLLLLTITFSLNYGLSILRHHLFCPFDRDCSITIILCSVAIFMLFRGIKFHSVLINILASNVLSIYVFEGVARLWLSKYISLGKYVDSWYLFAIIAGMDLVIMAACIIINTLRNHIAAPIDAWIISLIFRIYGYCCGNCNKYVAHLTSALNRF